MPLHERKRLFREPGRNPFRDFRRAARHREPFNLDPAFQNKMPERVNRYKIPGLVRLVRVVHGRYGKLLGVRVHGSVHAGQRKDRGVDIGFR